MVLARLHRALAVGTQVAMAVRSDGPYGDLSRVIVGAGFVAAPVETGRPVRMVRANSLPDIVGPRMRLLVCGLNPSEYAAHVGVGYARPGNRFWPAALAAGLVSIDRDPVAALVDHGIGFTDLVKRATRSADELAPAEYRSGIERVRWLVGWLRPAAVCFVGLAGWRAAVERRAQPGPQAAGFAGSPAYVMPSTSGINASSNLASLTAHLVAAARLADG